MDIKPPKHDLSIFEDYLGHDHQLKFPGDYAADRNPVLELIEFNFDTQSIPSRYTQVAYIFKFRGSIPYRAKSTILQYYNTFT